MVGAATSVSNSSGTDIRTRNAVARTGVGSRLLCGQKKREFTILTSKLRKIYNATSLAISSFPPRQMTHSIKLAVEGEKRARDIMPRSLCFSDPL